MTAEPVTLINVFTVPAAESAAFLDRWRANAAVMAACPGFRRATMHEALRDEAEFRFVNVAQWDDAASLRDAQATPAFRESVQRLMADPDLHVVARPAVYRAAEDVTPTP